MYAYGNKLAKFERELYKNKAVSVIWNLQLAWGLDSLTSVVRQVSSVHLPVGWFQFLLFDKKLNTISTSMLGKLRESALQ